MLIFKKFAKDKPAVLGLIIVLIVILVAIFAPLLAPYPGDVSASHLLRRLKPPTWAYPFGSDNLGRDIFSRVILGTRGALMIAVTVVGLAMVIGVPLGLIGGYYTGWGSEFIMRVTDKVLAANRANTRKSTGPRTKRGKNRVRLNALRHGFFARGLLLTEEDRGEFDQLR